MGLQNRHVLSTTTSVPPDYCLLAYLLHTQNQQLEYQLQWCLVCDPAKNHFSYPSLVIPCFFFFQSHLKKTKMGLQNRHVLSTTTSVTTTLLLACLLTYLLHTHTHTHRINNQKISSSGAQYVTLPKIISHIQVQFFFLFFLFSNEKIFLIAKFSFFFFFSFFSNPTQKYN